MRAESAVMWALGMVGITSVVSTAVWRLSHSSDSAVIAPRTAATASSSASTTGPRSDSGPTMTPAFAWPTGKLARLDVTHTRERTGVPTAQATATYDVSVEARADGKRRIDFGSPRPAAVPGQPPPQAIDLMNPSLIVEKDGTLLGVDGEQALVQQLAQAVGKTPGAPPPAQLERLMAAVVQARAHNGWDTLVATWSGRKLPIRGEEQAVLTDLAPTPDAAPMRIVTTIRTEGSVPCKAEDGAKGCIQIESVGTPDPASSAILATALEQQMGASGVTLRFKSLEIRVSLVTESSTLLPHHHELERKFTVELTQGTSTQVVTQVERQVQRFTYSK